MKIQAAGISGSCYCIMENYLTGGRLLFKRRECEYGIPQGSPIGPWLFSMHVIDLPDWNQKQLLTCLQMILEFYTGGTIDEVKEDLQETLNEM